MSRLPSALLALASVLSLSCDRSSEFADCRPAPGAEAPGAQRDCPPATFSLPDERSRDIAGIVRRGENGASGAIVHVRPAAGLPAEAGAATATTSAGELGAFGPIRYGALRYDLSARDGSDVMVYLGAAYRYLQPTFESSSPEPARGWRGRVELQVDPPLAAGQRLAFFASGERALAVEGDLEHGLQIVGLDYASPATLHAVAYAAEGDLATAAAYGKVDVIATPGAVQLARVHLDPIAEHRETMIRVTTQPGFEPPRSVDVIVGYSRTSWARFTTLVPGVTARLPLLPDRGYFAYRVRAVTRDGAVADSGEKFFDVFAPEVVVKLGEAPRTDAPDGGSGPASALRVAGAGLYEHLFAPVGRGPAIHVIAREAEITLPDVAPLGIAPPKGAYRWTVRAYPELQFVEQLGGLDARRYLASGTSAPRELVFP